MEKEIALKAQGAKNECSGIIKAGIIRTQKHRVTFYSNSDTTNQISNPSQLP